MSTKILDHRGQPFSPLARSPAAGRTPRQAQKMLRARFDQQFTTDENRRHWELADAMSIDASASWMVRRILRMRCRYEYHNNPWMHGGARRLANFVIGTGPRLHVTSSNPSVSSAIQTEFAKWAKKAKLARKLRVSRAARFFNGEGFLLLRTNPKLKHPVKLDLHEVEADQVSSPLFGLYPSQYPDQYFDGVVLDPWGNPQTYHVLRQHPGAFGAFVLMGYEFDPWPAQFVMHDYQHIRPGQQRGIPEAIPALDEFAELRRYRKAVLSAAENVAENHGVLKTEGGADDGDDDEEEVRPAAMDKVRVERGTWTVLPANYDLSQIKAEQPITTYDNYVMALLTEISQTLDMPLFIFTGDARLANMSSAYVATQSFIKSVAVDRENYEAHLDTILEEWMDEARRIPGLIPRDVPADLSFAWRWDRVSNHADPAKMASAQTTRLDNGTSSIPRECALEGTDWEEEQIADAKALGMTIDDYRAALRQKRFAIRGQPSPVTDDTEPATPANPTDGNPADLPGVDDED